MEEVFAGVVYGYDLSFCVVEYNDVLCLVDDGLELFFELCLVLFCLL